MLITGYVWLIVHVFYIKKIYKIPTKDRGLEIEMIHVSNNDNSCDITDIRMHDKSSPRNIAGRVFNTTYNGKPCKRF